MTDEQRKALVERLREEADTWDEPKSRDDFDMRGLLHGAADEIERLRAALKRIAGGWPKPMQLARETLEKKK
jgi:hypothetical protein